MSQSTSVQSFTLFPLLPIELRHKIWAHAIDSLPPRILDPHSTLEIPAPNYPLPALLQTTHESRCIALKTYLPWPKLKSASALLELAPPFVKHTMAKLDPRIYSWIHVSPVTDVFIVRLRNLSWTDMDATIEQSKEDLYRQMRHIAIHRAEWQRHLWQIHVRMYGEGERKLGKEELLFDRFKSLETIDLFILEGDRRGGDGLHTQEVTSHWPSELDYWEQTHVSGYELRMTGDEALRMVKGQIGNWKVPVLRLSSLQDHPPE